MHNSRSKNDLVDIGSMLKADPVSMGDVESALDTTKSSSMDGQNIKYKSLPIYKSNYRKTQRFNSIFVFSRYEEWQTGFGNV